jgi:hypothetical protein
VLAALAATACVLGQGSAGAATPAADTISAGSPTTSWQGQFYGRAQTIDPSLCPRQELDPFNTICDHFQLTVQDAGAVTVIISWPSPGCATNPTNLAMLPCASADINDFDLYVYDSGGTLVASSANTGPTEDPATFTATAGATYEVRVIPFDVTLSDYEGTATLAPTGGGGGGGQGGGGIDPPVSIGNASVVEGNTGTVNAVFPVTMGWSTISPVTVNYATADPQADTSATAGVDYLPQTGTVVFQPGQTETTISVPVVGDFVPEPDETFIVHLYLPDPPLVVAKIQDGQGLGTIIDDDTRRVVQGSGTVGAGSFALRVAENLTGKLRYRDASTRFYSSRITSVTFTDLTRSARIEGTGWDAGHSVTFTLDVTDGLLIAPDTFTLALSDGAGASGPVSGGRIT